MNTAFARQQMVGQQIRTWEVHDGSVLALFDTIHRDDFVPDAFRALAYGDFRVPLGHGQYMMTPSVEGRLVQALAIGAKDRVLEIGTGSAFLTVCLAHLAEHVVSIDIEPDFVNAAADRLERQGIDNVSLSLMDASESLPEGEFDVIAVTGSMPSVDARLVDALRPGGRMFVVTGSAPIMDARLVTRGEDSDWHAESVFETLLGRLRHFDEPAGFRF